MDSDEYIYFKNYPVNTLVIFLFLSLLFQKSLHFFSHTVMFTNSHRKAKLFFKNILRPFAIETREVATLRRINWPFPTFLQGNSWKSFGRCLLNCLLHYIQYLSFPLHTNSWDDISRTLFENYPVCRVMVTTWTTTTSSPRRPSTRWGMPSSPSYSPSSPLTLSSSHR